MTLSQHDTVWTLFHDQFGPVLVILAVIINNAEPGKDILRSLRIVSKTESRIGSSFSTLCESRVQHCLVYLRNSDVSHDWIAPPSG